MDRCLRISIESRVRRWWRHSRCGGALAVVGERYAESAAQCVRQSALPGRQRDRKRSPVAVWAAMESTSGGAVSPSARIGRGGWRSRGESTDGLRSGLSARRSTTTTGRRQHTAPNACLVWSFSHYHEAHLQRWHRSVESCWISSLTLSHTKTVLKCAELFAGICERATKQNRIT